jgi:hypothetical protein
MGLRLKLVGAWVDYLFDLGNISLVFEFKVACEVLCDHVALKVSLCFLEVVVIY